MLKWQTPDGLKPTDRSDRVCTILSQFANAVDLDCEKAIALAFGIGFGVFFVILVVIFIIVKRRYVSHSYFRSNVPLAFKKNRISFS